MIDQGDSHVLASALELDVDYLVSLDKKHILALKNKIKKFAIASPKELIEKLQIIRSATSLLKNELRKTYRDQRRG